MRINKDPVKVAVLLISLASAVASGQTTDHTFSEVTLNPAQGTLLPQLAAAVQKADQQGLTPVVDVGASWCEPCHLVDAVIHLPEMGAIMQKMYVIHLDLDVWGRRLRVLGINLESVPRVFALGHTGMPSGELWRPNNIPDSLKKQKGDKEAFRLSLITYFATARANFAQAQPAEQKKTVSQ
jgi:thiol-disulfide isomerase/thioredoxin